MATVTKGKTFISGEVVTTDKLHEMVDNATVTAIVNADIDAAAAIAAGKLASTLDLSTKTVTLPNTCVAAANIASNAVEEAKIASNAVTGTKIANASVTPAKLSQPLTLGTAQSSTSGTDIDFTGIPSWVNRVTIMFTGVSVNGTSPIRISIGDSGGIEAAGYNGCGSRLTATAVATALETSSFTFNGPASAAVVMGGHFILTRVTGNTWAASGAIAANDAIQCVCSGSKTLSDVLDRVRISCVSSFDAGTINVMYEG